MNEPKERPIIFSTPMVRAILEGKKTQTRRVLKYQPEPFKSYDDPGPFVWFRTAFPKMKHEGRIRISELSGKLLPFCPYGVPGDRLWVRETWGIGQQCKDGPDIWYKATEERCAPMWKSSMFMPRAYSRITLEICTIRVERLQDISEADAQAEGVQVREVLYADEPHSAYSYAEQYKLLWESIYGAGAWELTPWVWVVEFKRLKP